MRLPFHFYLFLKVFKVHFVLQLIWYRFNVFTKKNYFVKFLSGSILENSARFLKQWQIKHTVTMQPNSIKINEPLSLWHSLSNAWECLEIIIISLYSYLVLTLLIYLQLTIFYYLLNMLEKNMICWNVHCYLVLFILNKVKIGGREGEVVPNPPFWKKSHAFNLYP